MIRHASQLFQDLHHHAIDCNSIPLFNHYASITANWAQKQLLLLMKPHTIYRLGERLLVKKFDMLCVIYLKPVSEELPVVCMDMPFSVKHLCQGQYRPKEVRRISDYFLFNQLISSIADFD